jgi:peptide/nickel transport system substrate-binding protein
MRKGLIGLLATTAIVFAACQGAATPSPSAEASPSPSGAAASPSPSPEPTPVDYEALLFNYDYQPTTGTPGGSVIISDWQAANQLNPYYSNAFANSQVFAATMRNLAVVTSDGHWKGDLSSDDQLPKFSADGVVTDPSGGGFTVKLGIRPGLKWSDGETLDLNDLKYTWTWVMDPDNTAPKIGWDQVDTFTVAADGLTAEVHFKAPFAGWFGTLLGSPLLPEHYMSTIPIKDAVAKSYPISAALANAPVSGPFKYVTASPDTIELARNDNWAGPTAACSGKACLDKVVYKYYPDNKDGEVAAFLAGEIDVAEDLVQADYDAIKVVDPATGKALLEPSWLYEHFDMNEAGLGQGKGHPALQDTAVRIAMAEAIDKKAMYQTVFPGAPVPETSACTNATPSNYWQLPDAQCPAYDVAKANADLDAAGYKDTDGDGVRNMPNGGPNLVFEHCTSTAGFRQTGGEFLAKSMEAIGIKLNLNFVDSTAVLFANWPDVSADTKCNLAHGNYDTSEFAYVLSFDLFGDYYYSYHSEQIPTDANNGDGYNYLRLNNKDMDDALNTLKDAINPEDQVLAAYTVQQVYTQLQPEIALYYRNEVRGVSAKLNNFFYNPGTSSDMWNIEDWWVTQ